MGQRPERVRPRALPQDPGHGDLLPVGLCGGDCPQRHASWKTRTRGAGNMEVTRRPAGMSEYICLRGNGGFGRMGSWDHISRFVPRLLSSWVPRRPSFGVHDRLLVRLGALCWRPSRSGREAPVGEPGRTEADGAAGIRFLESGAHR